MGEIINPYIAGAPVTEQRMFFGREDVFNWIQNSLAGQYADHILVVHGQRRVGKTSVLKQLGNRLPKRYIPVFFDLQGRTHTTLDRFLWWLAREITRVLKQERGIEIPLPDKEAFTADIEYFENRFLPDLQPALAGATLLLTFDEFDNLEENEVKEELARPLVDHLRRMMGSAGLSFIFSIGSSGRKLENMQAAYTEFFKTALYKKISFLNEEQTHGLITRPVEGIIEYERAAVERIYNIASGHPYFTQLTCHELFARCQRTEQRKIAKSDVEAILEDVVERGTVNLKFVWDEASDIEKWSLAALAQLDKPDPRAVADYLRKNRVRFSETDLTSGLLHLREKDVLTSDNRFVIHLLKLWLQKNRPIEQAREELTEVNPIANRYIEIGLEFKDSRVYDKAIESFQEALAISKDNLQAQVNIALMYMDQKLYDKAVVEFEKALALDDEDVSARSGLCEAHLALGDSALARGRAKDATLSYQRVLAMNAEHLEARGRMAEIRRQHAEKALADGKDEEALSAFAEALRFTPEDQSLIARVEKVRAEKKAKVLAALVARSEKEASAKSWEKSLAALSEALELAPGESSILARIESVRARQLRERLDAILAKADQAEKSSRWDMAINALGEYLSIQPGDAAIQKRLDNLKAAKRSAWLGAVTARADAAIASERWDEAAAALNEVLSQEPGNAGIAARMEEMRAAERAAALRDILRRAEGAALAGRWDEAVEALNAGLASEPENETLQAKLIEVRKAKREARLKAALRLADTAAQAGKWDSAIAALNEALAIEPDNAELQKKLSELRAQERSSKLNAARTQARGLARAERFDESLKAWDEYMKLSPDDREAAQAEIESVKKAQNLARNYADAYKAYSKKNYEKAIGLFKSIVMENADYKDASRLLAESVELRRTTRKWWQSKILWGGIGIVALIAVAWSAFRYGLPLLAALPVTTAAPMTTNTPGTTIPDADSATATVTLPPTGTPTPLPYSWARVNSGNVFPRAWITTIAIDPTDPGILYVGTYDAGVYKSIDGGLSWQPVHNGLGRAPFYSIVIDPANPQTLYAGALQGGVYKTTDGGASWQTNNNGIEDLQGGKAIVLIDPQDSQHLYFTQGSDFYETLDGGSAWAKTQESSCPENFLGLVAHPKNNQILYAGTGGADSNCENGVYISQDSGHTWSLASVLNEVQHLSINTSGDQIYARNKSSSGPSMYMSADEGKTWELVSPNFRSCAEDPLNPLIAYCGSTGGPIYRTKDGGKTWQEIYTCEGLFLTDVLSISPHNPELVWAGTLGCGLVASDDGGNTWTARNSGMGAKFSSLTIDPFDDNTLYSSVFTLPMLYRSNDKGSTWKLISTNWGDSIAFGASPGILARADGNTIFLSVDGGNSWTSSTLENMQTSRIQSNPYDPGAFYGFMYPGDDLSAPFKLYRSDDNGLSWIPKSASELSCSGNPWLVFDQGNAQRLFAACSSDILRSDDGGESWIACADTGGLTEFGQRLFIDPLDGNRLIATTQGNGILLSTDGCQSWQESNTGLGSLFVNTVTIDPNNPDTIYAGTDGGAYISFDGGQTWGQVNDGLLGATVVYSIVVDKDSNVYAATPYGIFKLEGR